MKKRMSKRMRRSLMAGTMAATLGITGLAGAGLASADSTNTGQASLVDQIASKFNLNKDEVAAVFAADRQAHQAQMQADQATRLAQAVTDGKLTQAQADYITNARKEIEALRRSADPGQETDATRTSVKAKMDALRTWAQTNNVDLQYVGPGGHGGPNGAASTSN